MAYNLRAIHISEFLEKLKPLEGISGEERKKLASYFLLRSLIS